MRKATLNFIVDAVAFAAFLGLAATGVLIRYTLPPGSGHFHQVWTLDRHQWGNIHFWLAVSMLTAMALHLLLHWRWIITMVKGRPSSERHTLRTAAAIVALLALIALALAPLLAPITTSNTPPPHRQRTSRITTPTDANGNANPDLAPQNNQSLDHDQDTPAIDGSMSLRQVEQTTGVPLQLILQDLNLPADTSPNARLGQLRRQYDFDMHAVRDIIRQRQTPTTP